MRTSSTQNKPSCLSSWLSLSLCLCAHPKCFNLSVSVSLSRSLSVSVCSRPAVMENIRQIDSISGLSWNCVCLLTTARKATWKSLREVCSAGSQARKHISKFECIDKSISMLLGLLVLHMYTLCVPINKIIDSVHGRSHNEICMRALVNINQLISCRLAS